MKQDIYETVKPATYCGLLPDLAPRYRSAPMTTPIPGTVTYAITGGADQALFAIDADSGVVSFKSAPDFEAQGDDDTNNVYAFTVTATATAADGVTTQTTTQDVAVTVTDADNPTSAVTISNDSRDPEQSKMRPLVSKLH